MSLKENLISLMRAKQLTVQELADETDISVPTIKKLRSSDKSNPTLDILRKLSFALHTPINQLIGDDLASATIYQSNESLFPIETLPDHLIEFTVVFTQITFGFQKGCKAIFKRYVAMNELTKYILLKNGVLLEAIDLEKLLFRDIHLSNFSVSPKSIFAFVVRELMEVTYV